MNKNLLSLCFVLIIATYVTAQAEVVPTNPTAKNYCDNNYCESCEYIATPNMKSCRGCIYSVRKAVDGQTDVFECTERNSISNCMNYHSNTSSNTDAGCSTCKGNYVRKAKVGTFTKPTWECVKPTTALSITNCDIYDIRWNGTTETVTCAGCNSGYGLSSDRLSCSAVTAAMQKAQCRYTNADGTCSVCKSGFRKDSALKECVAYTFKGCDGDSTTKCNSCDVINNYFNVDLGLDDSKVCKSYEMILKISALVLAFMTLF
jgi:hypothetical protein